jgi:hypothetical protein
VILFSQAGEIAFDIPDSAKNYWGVTVQRDQNGIGRRSVVDEGPTGGQEPRLGWKRGRTEIRAREGVATWRYFLGYTLENTETCVVSSTVELSPAGQSDHAVTVPDNSSIQRIQISTVNPDTGAERVCASWQSKDAVPAETKCGGESGDTSFWVRKYSEPVNPPITEGITKVAPIFLGAAQGFRFGCSGANNNHLQCRIEVRWNPPTS